MATVAGQRDIGSFLLSKAGVAPQSFSGATPANGTGFDRTGYESLVVAVQAGATTGSPTAFSLTAKVQHSADNSTFADYSVAGTVPQVAVTAANTLAELDVDLSGAKQYVRVVLTPSFTGGTSPTVLGGAVAVLGGAVSLPA